MADRNRTAEELGASPATFRERPTAPVHGPPLGVDGQTHGKAELRLLKASDRERQGARKLLLEFHPTGLDPGRYALVLNLKDPGTGKAAETMSTFDVPQ